MNALAMDADGLGGEVMEVPEQYLRHLLGRVESGEGGAFSQLLLGAMGGGLHVLGRLPHEVAVDGGHRRSLAQQCLDLRAATSGDQRSEPGVRIVVLMRRIGHHLAQQRTEGRHRFGTADPSPISSPTSGDVNGVVATGTSADTPSDAACPA